MGAKAPFFLPKNLPGFAWKKFHFYLEKIFLKFLPIIISERPQVIKKIKAASYSLAFFFREAANKIVNKIHWCLRARGNVRSIPNSLQLKPFLLLCLFATLRNYNAIHTQKGDTP